MTQILQGKNISKKKEKQLKKKRWENWWGEHGRTFRTHQCDSFDSLKLSVITRPPRETLAMDSVIRYENIETAYPTRLKIVYTNVTPPPDFSPRPLAVVVYQPARSLVA